MNRRVLVALVLLCAAAFVVMPTGLACALVPPPVTTISTLPTGWVNHDVGFTLSVFDPGGYTSANTYYRLNSSAPATYTSAVTVSWEGTVTISYYTRDLYNYGEATKTAAVYIDKSSPVTVDYHVATYFGTASVPLLATDACSGVAMTAWTLDGAPGTGTRVTTGAPGVHTLAFWSTDNVGNVESAHTATFTVVPPTLTRVKLSGRASVRRNRTYKLAGTIAPAAAGGWVKIVLQRLVGRKWKAAGSKSVAIKGGKFAYGFKPKHRGTWRASASYGGQRTPSALYQRSSATRTFKVR